MSTPIEKLYSKTDAKLHEAYKEFYEEHRPEGWWINHQHRCEYDMLYSEKTGKKKCKAYLKSQGKKRDKLMCCCDTPCPHMRTIVLKEQKDEAILFVD